MKRSQPRGSTTKCTKGTKPGRARRGLETPRSHAGARRVGSLNPRQLGDLRLIIRAGCLWGEVAAHLSAGAEFGGGGMGKAGKAGIGGWIWKSGAQEFGRGKAEIGKRRARRAGLRPRRPGVGKCSVGHPAPFRAFRVLGSSRRRADGLRRAVSCGRARRGAVAAAPPARLASPDAGPRGG